MNRYLPILRVVFLASAVATIALADDSKEALRLDSVIWNPVDHTLKWSVSKGAIDSNGKFQGSNQTMSYEIDMDAAVMSVKGERRGFSKVEAVTVRRLMDMVAKYAAESTVWWDEGQGEPLDKRPSKDLVEIRPSKE